MKTTQCTRSQRLIWELRLKSWCLHSLKTIKTTQWTRFQRWIWEHFSFIHNMFYISFKTFISSKKYNVDIPSKHKQLQQPNVQWGGESAVWKYCSLNENSNTVEMLMPCCECWINPIGWILIWVGIDLWLKMHSPRLTPVKYLDNVCLMEQLVIKIKVQIHKRQACAMFQRRILWLFLPRLKTKKSSYRLKKYNIYIPSRWYSLKATETTQI